MMHLGAIFKHNIFTLVIVIVPIFLLSFPPKYFPSIFEITGEEAIFYYLIVNNPELPEALIFAYIENKPYFTIFQHPTSIYLIFSIALVPLMKIYGIFIEQNQSIFLASYSSLQIIIIYILIFLFERIYRIKLLIKHKMILLLFFLTPLFAANYTIIQIDTSVGLILFAFIILILAKFEQNKNPIIIFLATCIYSLGRTEWSVWLICGAVIAAIFLRDSKSLRLSLLIISAVLVGNFFSFLIDPENYLASFSVISRTQSASNQNDFSYALILSIPYLILALYTLGKILRNTKKPEAFFLTLLSSTILIGFLTIFVHSYRILAPRYYFPLLVMSLFLLMFNICHLSNKQSIILMSFFVFFNSMSMLVLESAPSVKDAFWHSEGFPESPDYSLIKEECLNILPIWVGLQTNNNWISNTLSKSDIQEFAKTNNLLLCN